MGSADRTARNGRDSMSITTENFGTVNHNGATITLTQAAYANNHGTDGGVRYRAHGVDSDGGEYLVEWDTTASWDAAEAAYKADPENAAPNEDESTACDWGSPASVTAI